MQQKTYTAQEIVDKIYEGWSSENELKELYEFVEAAQMESEEELEKLCELGYVTIVYEAYEFIREKYE